MHRTSKEINEIINEATWANFLCHFCTFLPQNFRRLVFLLSLSNYAPRLAFQTVVILQQWRAWMGRAPNVEMCSRETNKNVLCCVRSRLISIRSKNRSHRTADVGLISQKIPYYWISYTVRKLSCKLQAEFLRI